MSRESGRDVVLLRSFPAASVKRQISIEGGIDPRWRQDGKELFYYSSTGQLMAVPITTGETTLDAGKAIPLFMPGLVNDLRSTVHVHDERAQYDVSPDGQRFLLNVPAATQENEIPPSINVVLNWTAGAK